MTASVPACRFAPSFEVPYGRPSVCLPVRTLCTYRSPSVVRVGHTGEPSPVVLRVPWHAEIWRETTAICSFAARYRARENSKHPENASRRQSVVRAALWIAVSHRQRGRDEAVLWEKVGVTDDFQVPGKQ